MILRGVDRDEGISNKMLAREKWQVKTLQVLEKVFEERCRQVARYGHNEDLEDGFGPDERPWLQPLNANTNKEIEVWFRKDYEGFEAVTGQPTWMHLIREELAEMFCEEPDSQEAADEAIQVAALLVSWAEKRVS